MRKVEMTGAQKRAIEHGPGPALVLAGPGSGKTLVITYRVRHLIEHWGISPSNILVITFTRAAAEEMEERFEKLAGGATSAVTFGTFHSIFFRILRHAYHYDAGNILKEGEKNSLMHRLAAGLQMDLEDLSEFAGGVLEEISSFKNSRVSLTEFVPQNCTKAVFERLYTGYEGELRRMNKIDFDDMLLMTWELLSGRPDICGLWQRKYEYILIDEFQDINQVQYDVIRLLAGEKRNLFIVGDDDQSIYRFRGARPEIMLGFQKDYPEAVQIVLDCNFRSTENIVRASENLIVHNEVRYEKHIQAAGEPGEPVVIIECENLQAENDELIDKIRMHVQSGAAYSDIAVLYRTNTAARAVTEKLVSHGVPFQTRDRFQNVFEHWVTRDIFAYLELAAGDKSRSTLLQVMNRPNRYIHREALISEQFDFSQLKRYYREQDWMQERIVSLEKDLLLLGKMRPFAAVNYIRRGIGYDTYIEAYSGYRQTKPDEFFEILDGLMESAAAFDTLEAWKKHIAEYTRQLQEQSRREKENANSVTLTTMHSAKGLEYPVVFVVDVNESVIPHHRAVEKEDIEEERRLFYVAVTRAKEYLYLLYTRERYHKRLKASRYLYELTGAEKEEKGTIEILKDKK